MARKNFKATGGINIDSSTIPTSIIQETITSNSATTVDTIALNSFVTAEYTVALTQGSKIRTSKVIMQTDGSSVDMTEFAITETGGTMSGVVVSATTASTNAILQVTVTDAASTIVRYKLIRNITTKIGYAPDAPIIGTATSSATGEASITFTAPLDNGNSSITSYTVTSNPEFRTGTGSSSPITVTGLSSGGPVEYTFTVTATNEFGTSSSSAASNPVTPEPTLFNAEYLVVAGGGGGGVNSGGGGGAGGYRSSSMLLAFNTAYTVTVGAGGAPGGEYSQAGNGTNSQLATISSSGGGGGGGGFNNGSGMNGAAGGSGGGAASGIWSYAGGGAGNIGNYTPPEGYNGYEANSNDFPPAHAGGGGGAGGNASGSVGANGAESSITGTATYYAGGGGGSANIYGSSFFAGGLGGGGSNSNGSVNTGGGGSNGSGGSGIVIVATTATVPNATVDPTLSYTLNTSSRPGYKVYNFTGGTGSVQWNS